MTINTQDCKDFISSISHTIHSNVSDKWKRTKKYKQNSLILRDFENQDGRKLTIAEHNNQLFLFQLSELINFVPNSSILKNNKGQLFLGHLSTDEDVFSFMANCVRQDPSIVYDEDDTLEDAIRSKSWTVWEKWSKNCKKDSYYEHPLDDFLSNDGNWGEFDLFYPDEDGNQLEIVKEDLISVYWVGMSDYDTAFRIYVFETFDHQLWLGCNNPD